MTLAIATIFYNNSIEELLRLVNSVPDKAIDKWIWIDGIFKYTKEQNPQLPDLTSIDTLLDSMIDSHYHIEHIFLYKPNYTEFEKRNAYLTACKELDIDYLIIADTDEHFIYDHGVKPEKAWEMFRYNFEIFVKRNGYHHNVFSIRTYDPNTNTESSCPRCWYNPGDMRYLNNSHYHYGNMYSNEEEVTKIFSLRRQNLNYCQESKGVIKGLTLAHDHSLRSEEQMKLRLQYQQYIVRYEELVQNGWDHEAADKKAKLYPATDFKPT